METTSPLVERHCAHAPEISNILCSFEGCAPLSNQATALSHQFQPSMGCDVDRNNLNLL